MVLVRLPHGVVEECGSTAFIVEEVDADPMLDVEDGGGRVDVVRLEGEVDRERAMDLS